MTTPTDIPALLERAKTYVAWCEGKGPSTPSLSPREVRDIAAALEDQREKWYQSNRDLRAAWERAERAEAALQKHIRLANEAAGLIGDQCEKMEEERNAAMALLRDCMDYMNSYGKAELRERIDALLAKGDKA